MQDPAIVDIKHLSRLKAEFHTALRHSRAASPKVPGGADGLIRIPAIGVDAAFVEGITDQALAEGPGHYPTTPMPGRGGNVAIAGHRTTHGAPFWALDATLDQLTETLGDDPSAWTWGAIHPVRFAGRLAGAVPDLAELFTAAEAPWGGDEMTVSQGAFEPNGTQYPVAAVASWRQIIDLGDLDRSIGTHTVGQSGNPASAHWNDLFELWSTGRHHPMPFTRHAVEAAIESRLELLSKDEPG